MRYALMPMGLLFFLTGCGQNLAPVSGRVTLDKNLWNATMVFLNQCRIQKSQSVLKAEPTRTASIR